MLDIPDSRFLENRESVFSPEWVAPPLAIENPVLPRADFVWSRDFGLVCPRSLALAHPESDIVRDCQLHAVRIDTESQEYVILRPRHVLAVNGDARAGIFRMNEGSLDICVVAETGADGRPVDGFLDVASRYTGLDWRLLPPG